MTYVRYGLSFDVGFRSCTHNMFALSRLPPENMCILAMPVTSVRRMCDCSKAPYRLRTHCANIGQHTAEFPPVKR